MARKRSGERVGGLFCPKSSYSVSWLTSDEISFLRSIRRGDTFKRDGKRRNSKEAQEFLLNHTSTLRDRKEWGPIDKEAVIGWLRKNVVGYDCIKEEVDQKILDVDEQIIEGRNENVGSQDVQV